MYRAAVHHVFIAPYVKIQSGLFFVLPLKTSEFWLSPCEITKEIQSTRQKIVIFYYCNLSSCNPCNQYLSFCGNVFLTPQNVRHPVFAVYWWLVLRISALFQLNHFSCLSKHTWVPHFESFVQNDWKNNTNCCTPWLWLSSSRVGRRLWAAFERSVCRSGR